MGTGDSAPTKGGRSSKKSEKSSRSGKSEKGVSIAGSEVVGRPVAVWSQKRMEWPEGVVAKFNPGTKEHLVRFKDPSVLGVAEKWFRLGSIRFQWLKEQPEGAKPNPTAAGGPKDHDCVGRRVKVFWPGMGRWYQGKVQSYDPATKRHRVKYRDGDVQQLRLRHEAVIWVDVGPMPGPGATPPTAQKPSKPSPPGPSNTANKPAAPNKPAASKAAASKPAPSKPAPSKPAPSKLAAAQAGTPGSGSKPPAVPKAAGTSPPAPRANGTASGSKPPPAKRARVDSAGDGRKPSKSSATKDIKAAAASGAPPSKDKGEHPTGRASSSGMESAYSGQSGGLEAAQHRDCGSSGGRSEEEGTDGDSSVMTADLGSEVYSSDLDEGADSDFEVESRRSGGALKASRRRPGTAGPSVGRSSKGGHGGVFKKKSSSGKLRRSSGGAGVKDRSGKSRGEPSRGGSLRSKVLRGEDEGARAAAASVMGARVAVLWSYDQQYYKGKLVQFDSYHKRTKILYDDGEEEWVSLGRETFKWLLPRGRSAGYGGAVRAALAQLGAHVTEGPGVTPPGGASPPACEFGGDAGGGAGQGPPQEEAAVGYQVCVLFDGDGRRYRGEVLAYDRRRGRHLVLYDDGEEEWLDLGRERLTWHKPVQGAAGIYPGVKPGVPGPAGSAAVGWRVGVFWPSDAAFFTGEITAFDAAAGRHTVVYDDGEVRGVCLASDKVKWILAPGCAVDATRLLGMEANRDAVLTAGKAKRRAGGGSQGEWDLDEFGMDSRVRPAMRRLPRLLTTSSLASPTAGREHSLFGPPSLHTPTGAAAADHLLASPLSPGSARGGSSLFQPSLATLGQPLSPTAERSLGEPLLVRQLSQVPPLGSLSSSESETSPLPYPITVRIYMSGGGGPGGAAGEVRPSGAPEGSTAPPHHPANPHPAASPTRGPGAGGGSRRRAWGVQSKRAALDLMARRVMRAQQALVKGVPTHMHPGAGWGHASAKPAAAEGGGGHHAQHHPLGQPPRGMPQAQAQQPLHRLARASTADQPLSPASRRPHPALSDDDPSSSSGSSDDESGRGASPVLMLSPRAAAALHGAKVKPEQAQHAPGEPADGDSVLLDASGREATPSDSDAFASGPSFLRSPTHQDSPFSTGGLLRSPTHPPGLHVVPAKPACAGSPALLAGHGEEGGEPGEGPAPPSYPLAMMTVAEGSRPPSGPGPGPSAGAAAVPLPRGAPGGSSGAGMTDIAVPPTADAPAGLLSLGLPNRNDSEFNLLALDDATLTPMEDGALMELDMAAATVAHAAAES